MKSDGLPRYVEVDANGFYQRVTSLLDTQIEPPTEYERLLLVRDLADRFCAYEHSASSTYYNPDVEDVLAKYKVSADQYLKVISDMFHLYAEQIRRLDQLIEQLREDYVVDRSYTVTPALRIQIHLHCINPSRNYEKLLRDAVTQAQQAGEQIPYKYLKVLGLM